MGRNIYIPREIIVEILLNLPAKSLGRFSTVSKSWKAMISDEEFLRQHKRRASLPGRERILISHCPSSLTPATTRRLSSITSNQFDQSFVSPLHETELLVSCRDMWCVVSLRSLFLLNPSMGTYKKLPPPLSQIGFCFRYGMGFDSVADDYKILKLTKHYSFGCDELYSLRSNSWRKTHHPFPKQRSPYGSGVAVSNALHWMTKSPATVNNGRTIVSFDLSTEKYADNFPQPPIYIDPRPKAGYIKVDLTVLRGNLCVYMNGKTRFVLWEMQEYGDGKSWSKVMDYDVSSISPPRHVNTMMRPLYLDKNGWILMKDTDSRSRTAKIFLVDEDEWQIIWKGCDSGYATGLLYAESLVSPAGNMLQ